MATYAQTSDFEAYVEGWQTDDAGALERVLERAEEDIDDMLSGDYLTVNGRKRDPSVSAVNPMTVNEIKYLMRATCAQAEYRIVQGEDFFVQTQYDSVSGPDFSTSGKRPRIGPKTRRELARGRLITATGRAHA